MPDTIPDFTSLPRDADYRHVLDFPGYAVGSDGSVWSCRSRRPRADPYAAAWRLLKQTVAARSGHCRYRVVNLCRKGKPTIFLVHRLILSAFIGPCPPGMGACHNDGDPFNNRLDNLRWDTPAANCADMKLHGTQPRGLTHYNAKLTPDAVRRIRQLRAVGYSYAHIAVNFNVSLSTIHGIISGRSWRHVV